MGGEVNGGQEDLPEEGLTVAVVHIEQRFRVHVVNNGSTVASLLGVQDLGDNKNDPTTFKCLHFSGHHVANLLYPHPPKKR